MDGKKATWCRNRGIESRREEQKVQKEDDGKGTPCPAPNREEKQEAVAVIERDTAKTKLLNLPRETAAKCEVLLPVPQTSNPHTTQSPPWCSAQLYSRQLSSSKIYTHLHTHTL